MRKGIVSAGNWLSDTIKFISHYPAVGNLVTIEKIDQGFGGCAHNVLADLARMQTGIPLYAGGCVGKDALGDEIFSTCSGPNSAFAPRWWKKVRVPLLISAITSV